MDIVSLIQATKKANNRAIAIMLNELEAEFRYVRSIASQAERLLARMEEGEPLNTQSLTVVLSNAAERLPDYALCRKAILDAMNDLYRQQLQNIVGDIEGISGTARD